MIISLRKWLAALAFVVLFAVLTVIASGGYRWLVDKALAPDRYKEPQGYAVKVFEEDVVHQPDKASLLNRLRRFYLYGE
ncbi:YqzK family protein [Paenibacillus sp. IB182496]|uniref:YqzK family protein n=1 Tax=Paenibacillus sabuli TaxID=2772509 RepID=A0A927BVT9_9BACL|nr:DUF4227 family protein [Paenibacillus sabuli]MBD2846831.1 YqzK family protein [Paenibacillus sabuli]